MTQLGVSYLVFVVCALRISGTCRVRCFLVVIRPELASDVKLREARVRHGFRKRGLPKDEGKSSKIS